MGYSRPLPGASPLAVTKAIDKALVMGASIDSKLLKEAAEAHHKALNGIETCGDASRLHRCECSAREGVCVGPDQSSDGHVQRFREARGRKRPCQAFQWCQSFGGRALVRCLGGVCKRGEGCSTLAQTRDDCSHALSDVLALRFLKQLTTSASASHDLPCLLLRDLLSTSSSTAE